VGLPHPQPHNACATSLFNGMQLMMEAVAGSRRERYRQLKCAKVGTKIPSHHLPALCTVHPVWCQSNTPCVGCNATRCFLTHMHIQTHTRKHIYGYMYVALCSVRPTWCGVALHGVVLSRRARVWHSLKTSLPTWYHAVTQYEYMTRQCL